MINEEKILIGHIGVDSGTIYIGDPCYLRGEINPDDISHAIQKAWDNEKFTASLNYKLGHEGAGIVSSTYDGDGTYPIYAVFKNGENRPLRLIVDFCPEDS